MTEFSLEGKVALITGASRGIGEAIAMTLAEYHAECILVSRKMANLQGAVEKITRIGGKATPIECNMGYLKQIKGLFEQVKKSFGKLHILVNNAAANPHFGDMLCVDEGIWDKTNDVNLKGPFFTIKYAAPLIMESGGGSIVNVSSVDGLCPSPSRGVYSITKAGLLCMTKAYAKELAPKNIRVNALVPGLTETRFADVLISNKDIYEKGIKGIPMGRHAQPEEMAGAVLYLVSNASSFTTGTWIICDGGKIA